MASDPYAIPEDRFDSGQRTRRLRLTLFTLLLLIGIIAALVALILPGMRRGVGANRFECGNNLKNITLALLSYEEVYHSLPPAYTVAADGTRLHSWRTLILPYLEQQKLYHSIDLSKPWDDAENADARNSDLDVFRCPSGGLPPNHTTYMAVVAPNGCFRPGEPRRSLSEITDDHGSTLMVIEVPADSAVHWMAPMDANERKVLGITSDSQLPHTDGINVGLVDGSVRFIATDLPAQDRLALISVAGNDTVSNEF
jgi:prepilin-type processing-associated H-X9-DG protein